MRSITAAAILLMAVSASACGSDSNDSDDGEMVGGKGLDVCGLVSDKTVAELQQAAESKSTPVEGIMKGAETFVECRIISGVSLGFAVRAVPGGPTIESLTEGRYGDPPEPLTGVGDKALIGTNTYDGVRIAAAVGEQEVVVDSEFDDRYDPEISRDRLIALTKEIVANLGDTAPAAIALPKACPQPSDDKVVETVGEVVVARGIVADNGSVSCQYVGNARQAVLAAVAGDGGFSLMALADSDPDNRIEVDGDPALFDDGQIVVFRGTDCVLSASASQLDFSLSGEVGKMSSRREATDLVRYVDKEIGCPS